MHVAIVGDFRRPKSTNHCEHSEETEDGVEPILPVAASPKSVTQLIHEGRGELRFAAPRRRIGRP